MPEGRTVSRVPLWERLFAIAALFLSTGAVLPLLAERSDPAAAADSSTHPLWIAAYALVALLLARDLPAALATVRRIALPLTVVGLAGASAVWSDAPAVTVEKALGLALTTALGVYLASRYTLRDLLDLLAWALVAALAASLVASLFLPSYGLDHLRDDAWRGVFATKNGLGRVAALAALLWLLRARTHPVAALVVVPPALFLLLESRSKTAFLVFVVLALFLALTPLLRAHSTIAVPTLAVTAGAAGLGLLWLAGNGEAALAAIDIDPTLTGRREIWDAVWGVASERPWLGWGYGAFWSSPDNALAAVPLIADTPHAHNGFLDVWLDVGLVGVLLLSLSLAVNFVRAFVAMRAERGGAAMWPLLFLLFFVLANLSESSVLARNSLFWIVYVAVSARLAVLAARRAPSAAVQAAPAQARPNLRAVPETT